MPIILTAILETLLYLMSVPICVAFALSARDGLRFGIGVSAFERRAALRRAKQYRPMKKRRDKTVARSGWRIARSFRDASIRLQGRLGLGDAAATAIACGALNALAAALAAPGGRAVVDVTPVFSESTLCLELQGMIRFRTGQIMTAIARSQIENIRRRIASWTNIPLKA